MAEKTDSHSFNKIISITQHELNRMEKRYVRYRYSHKHYCFMKRGEICSHYKTTKCRKHGERCSHYKNTKCRKQGERCSHYKNTKCRKRGERCSHYKPTKWKRLLQHPQLYLLKLNLLK